MSPRDREQLRRWIAGRASLAEVETPGSIGLIGNERFTEDARRVYRWLWTWGAPRFGGEAGRLQDRLYMRRGAAALARRYDRVARILARIKEGRT